jgi:quinoprotein glucose dehydrogenase
MRHLPSFAREAFLVLILVAATSCASDSEDPAFVLGSDIDPADWPHYARDLAASKYSPLDQIHAGNVADLEIAWTWQSADYDVPERYPGTAVNNNYQATPIKIGDRLYTSTNLGQAVALDPATGRQLWRYDPYAAGLRDEPGGRASRGVAYWSDGAEERILLASGEYLVALDAATGAPIEGFGTAGAVDLADDPDPRVLTYSWTSAPLVVRDVCAPTTSGPVSFGGASTRSRSRRTPPPRPGRIPPGRTRATATCGRS